MLFAIAQDNLKLLDRLLKYTETHGDKMAINVIGTEDDDSDEFPPSMTALMLAAQCGRYELVEYLLSHGHKIERPHPPRCTCEEKCSAAARQLVDRDVVADGCQQLNAYRAISDPTYVCCTSADDPILVCFKLYDELLKCGYDEQVYKTVYASMAQQVIRFKVGKSTLENATFFEKSQRPNSEIRKLKFHINYTFLHF